MSTYVEILDLFVDIVIKSGNFTPAGVEKAFLIFQDSLKVHEHKPKPSSGPTEFVKTTLREAAEKAKAPVYILADINKYGNLESHDYPGLIFVKDDQGRLVAHGLQDGNSVQKLTMNCILICMANGWLYNKANCEGSASVCENNIATVVKK